MKKLISAVLATAMLLSSVPMIAHAEVASDVYTIDATSKTISKVAPLTKVSTFKKNFTGGTVDVVNVDGISMADDAYATENIFVNVDGEFYKIDVEYPYDPIQTYGRNYRKDGDVIFEKESANFNSTVDGQPAMTNSGFAYGISGYKLGDASGAAPAINAGAKTVVTKQTENGNPVYIFENNAPRYGFLRSHYSSASYESQTQSPLTDITKGKVSVTTVTFKTNMMGNVSLHHNAPGYATSFKGDAALERFTFGGYAAYFANAVHFTQDGTIKIGGTYTNVGQTQENRTPAHNTGVTWEPNKEYTVSVVQKLNDGGSRYGYVYGVYVNGEKIFPTANAATPGQHFFYDSTKDAYSMTTRSSDYKYTGGISSILIGAAPKNAGDAMKTTFSDVKVYTLASATDFTGKIDTNLVLENATDVEVDNAASVINVSSEETVASLRAKYDQYAIAVYNSDGTQPDASANLATGMSAKIVSDDGLLCKVFNITATSTSNQTTPESEVYTVDTEAKTVSGVDPFTTVEAFLASFANGSIMEVVNIDGSAMATSAYATENVSLKAPNGDLYAIKVNYVYAPIENSTLTDGTDIYNMPANQINNNELTTGGFARLQSYAKMNYGAGDTVPANTEDQTVKATKQSKNGENVIVMENDSNNYAYLRSHYTESYNNSTSLRTATYKSAPIVTRMSFIADKEGTVSLYHNVMSTADGDKRGDAGIDRIIESAANPYVANSVHFMEDGKIMLGGTYALYAKNYRNPAHDTGLTWVPGKEYTVSVVQKMASTNRWNYILGVYINGTKVFPFETSAKYGTQFAYQSDGSYVLSSKSSSYTWGGGISSVMVGTAPKTAGDNMSVELSDLRVYLSNAYNPAMDAPITLTSNNSTIVVDNDAATISCVDATVTAADLSTTAKIKIENGYVKAVSADGLVSKTYAIVSEDIQKGFYNGEAGAKVSSLAEVDSDVCFNVNIDDTSLLDGVAPVVILAAYNKSGHLLDCTFSTGTKYAGEITNYKPILDISAYDKKDLELRAYVWDEFSKLTPLTDISTLK